MSTVTMVAVGLWNALLLLTLAALVIRRKQLIRWITQDDGQQGAARAARGDEAWTRFLDEHPELTERR